MITKKPQKTKIGQLTCLNRSLFRLVGDKIRFRPEKTCTKIVTLFFPTMVDEINTHTKNLNLLCKTCALQDKPN